LIHIALLESLPDFLYQTPVRWCPLLQWANVESGLIEEISNELDLLFEPQRDPRRQIVFSNTVAP